MKDEDQEEEEELPADRTVDSKPTYPADVPEAMKDAPASLNAPVPVSQALALCMHGRNVPA